MNIEIIRNTLYKVNESLGRERDVNLIVYSQCDYCSVVSQELQPRQAFFNKRGEGIFLLGTKINLLSCYFLPWNGDRVNVTKN